MAALDTVANYVTSARVLLQDAAGDRYSDSELVLALSFAIQEARRLRPDLFTDYFAPATIPAYTANDGTQVPIDVQYRVPFLYYMVGHAQLRDEEDTQDQRSAALLAKFASQLLSLG